LSGIQKRARGTVHELLFAENHYSLFVLLIDFFVLKSWGLSGTNTYGAEEQTSIGNNIYSLSWPQG